MENSTTTQKIIGCAFKIYKKMGFDFLESVYEKCLLIELSKAGFHVESQVPITVYYDYEIVEYFVSDILVEDEIIIELKSILKLLKIHEIQLVNYLVATRKDIGILLNFSQDKVEIKRKIRRLSYL